MITHMAQNMLSRYPNWKGGYIETKYPVVKDFKTIGTLKIGYYGPFYFKDTDLTFINTLNRILIGVTVLAIFLAFLIGSYTARRLSSPISKATNIARAIATGNLEARSVEKTNIREIKQLTEAINHLAESLKQHETLRRRLTADVAHELRTPLATLQSHMEAMLDGIWVMDQERLKVCFNEILRVNRMVKDLEKLAKYESENLNLDITRFDLNELIQQIVINFETEFCRKKIAIGYTGKEITMNADRDKISQVIINLLSNSLKYTPMNGRVEISLSENNNIIEMTVSDTGIGISAEDLPYIFERFFRADQARTRIGKGGSGLGLAIAEMIIGQHDGKISVESEESVGTTVTVILPLGFSGSKDFRQP
jgi:signal transduction histidine kinase